ncbi:MAG: hypothetical protein JW965_00745 [Bacteroidales bacterium]|nr:hypothetical protein [Bacteroidales bacterium]
MKIGIHHSKDSFSERWITYCDEKGIPWKQVDCYSNNIMQQLSDCDALMWHVNQNNPKDKVFAKQLTYSVQAAGKTVFPDFNTLWHFDDKVGQKYLLEAINAPMPGTWIFYDKNTAFQWVNESTFPKVFKLRGGGGSQNVRLVRNARQARRMIRKAFRSGFLGYYAIGSMKERWRKYRLGKSNFKNLIEGVVRFIIPPPYARVRGREKGYIYFQEFIPENDFDIRIIIIGDKAFAIKRMIRKDDFRASGSGMVLYEKEHFDDETVRLSFKMADQLDTQNAAFDFVYYDDKIYVLEVSFGFIKEVYDPCTGYWDRDLVWHGGQFNPCEWMVDDIVERIKRKA